VHADYGVADVDPLGVDTLVAAGGHGVDAACHDLALVRWISAAGENARRVASVCSGVFLLAAAGLVTGRRVTTHWAREQQLRQAHPEVTVDCDPIFITDGRVWTSAGVTAGLDLALALVEDDHGREIAHAVAKELVMFLRRPGTQSQFSVPLWSRQPRSGPIRTVVSAIHADPGAAHGRAGWAQPAAPPAQVHCRSRHVASSVRRARADRSGTARADRRRRPGGGHRTPLRFWHRGDSSPRVPPEHQGNSY
jgi:transcriptional regulator GlxA family with amidase domain